MCFFSQRWRSPWLEEGSGLGWRCLVVVKASAAGAHGVVGVELRVRRVGTDARVIALCAQCGSGGSKCIRKGEDQGTQGPVTQLQNGGARAWGAGQHTCTPECVAPAHAEVY